MTIHEVATQMHKLSGGRLNGEQFSKRELEGYISRMFKGELALKNSLVMQIALPDGEWLCTVDRFADAADSFDYYIPDTRGQEARIWERLKLAQ